jgi:misacylated tRNA(Ala) deacylase
MTDLLYLRDSYLKEFDARVVATRGESVLPDRTAFYPGGGGQPHDTGVLRWDGGEARVIAMEKGNGAWHIIEGEVPETGTEVHGAIDWDRRYAIMRAHTAVHVISHVVYAHLKGRITGNQLYPAAARIDFNVPDFNRQKAEWVVEEANKIAMEGHEVKVEFVPREEVERHPEWVRVDPRLLPDVEVIRLVMIGDIDVQADGGTHVKNTREIGQMVVEKVENKGRNNKRVYVKLI